MRGGSCSLNGYWEGNGDVAGSDLSEDAVGLNGAVQGIRIVEVLSHADVLEAYVEVILEHLPSVGSWDSSIAANLDVQLIHDLLAVASLSGGGGSSAG